jgi:2-oxo-4-hydroxy-4-carboxy-5-ureidoimidazoline decarboxylase
VPSSPTLAPATLTVAEFDVTPREDCLALLHSFLDVDSWAERLCDTRPHATLDKLLTAAAIAGASTTPDEIMGALARHPRIGRRQGGGSREAGWSRAEQAAIAADSAAADLAAGNAAYEAKFGFIFLIRAAGRSADDVLRAMRERQENTLETEISIVRAELLEIADIRIRNVVVG